MQSNRMRRYPNQKIERDIDLKVALAEPVGKSATKKQVIEIPLCPGCENRLKTRTVIVDGKERGKKFYCPECDKTIENPEIHRQIVETPLQIAEQFTRDSTTGFYDSIDQIVVEGLDDICILLKYIEEQYGIPLQPAHDYFSAGKTKVSTISKGRNGQLTQALLTERIETTEKVEQKIEDKTSQKKKTGLFGKKESEN